MPDSLIYIQGLSSDMQSRRKKTCPRWASWNLGIFVCIRCAGIHRNLGVHISKVKSVNLDQWTQEQVQCVQEMGNAKAKRLYEAFLPECFQRPETDQSAEIFIRDKYDKKKYMDKKEKSCANIPREPVVFEKMKLNLSLFLDPPSRAEDGSRVRKMSKDSILSLYGSAPSVHANAMTAQAGLYMSPRGYPTHPYGGSFHSLGQIGGVGGAMMSSQMGMAGRSQSSMAIGAHQNAAMGPHAAAAQQPFMSGMIRPQGRTGHQQNGMMGHQQNGMMGHQQNGMMGHQQNGAGRQRQTGGPAGPPPRPAYGAHGQQPQQLQWNLSQMNQQMSGMSFYGTSGGGAVTGRGRQQAGEPTTSSSAHNKAAHVWK
ncbi:hypothetical protein NHX12_023868 [Muraenolepis orangiensis]|uniref:Arf-GAP domain-containing protein n=1 Tax=Muraenolepis orangiensis TaxID=630683 RepID=A0A9Q0EL51_9TELE|nr:hypothetical protein NHX12_023868 [Muraenolepis orangiensis]